MTEGGGQIGADGPSYVNLIDVAALIDEWDPIGVECRIDVGGLIDVAGQESDLMAAQIEDADPIADRALIDGVVLTDVAEEEIKLF